MLEFLSLPGMQPFAVSMGLLLAILALEVVAAIIGAPWSSLAGDADTDVDLDVDADVEVDADIDVGGGAAAATPTRRSAATNWRPRLARLRACCPGSDWGGYRSWSCLPGCSRRSAPAGRSCN